jgi:hypothetical protein
MQPVCRQRIDEHVPAAANTHATIELLLERVHSTRSLQRDYKEDNWGDAVSLVETCKGGAVVNLWDTEAERISIVESCYQVTASESRLRGPSVE